MITEPNEFMQKLQELQDSSSVIYSTLPSNEPRFIIDANSRTIKIPPEFQFLGVKNDHNAETVYFEIDRYFDDEDLSQHTCVVQFSNKNNSNDGGFYPVTTMDTTSVDGKIIFGWEIKSDATSLVGDIYFSVRFYSINSTDYVFTYNFNTLTAKSVILDTLDVDNPEIFENYPSELDAWTAKMDELSRGTEGKVEEVQQVSSEAIAEVNAVKESIPADYTTLSNDVNGLKGDLDELESLFDNAYNIVDESKIQLNHYYNMPWKPNDQPYEEGWRCVEVMVEPNTTYSVFGINIDLTWFSDSNYSDLGHPTTNNGNVTTPNGCDRMCVTTNSTGNIRIINKPDLPNDNYPYGLISVNIPKLEIDKNTIDITKNEQYVTDKNDYLSFKNEIINNSYTNLSVFQDIGIVGDSFASGGLYNISGVTDNAYYDISWGAILGRRNGINSHIYSAPSLSTRTWLSNTNRGLEKALSDNFTGLYLLCLGINDSWLVTTENYLGTIDDIKADYNNNPDTFYGNYAKIYEQLKEHSPNSKFVFITPPESTSAAVITATRNIANHYNIPIIESWGGDGYFASEFYLNNHSNAHPNAVAYAGMAQAYERMIVKCIENNKDYFFDYCGV